MKIQPDLEKVGKEIERWRAQRKGRERIPERFWKAAIALLQTHSFFQISRALKLNPKQFRKRCNAIGKGMPQKRKQNHTFLELSAAKLSAPISFIPPDEPGKQSSPPVMCRITIERADGSRINLSLPLDWVKIQTLCASFLQL